MRGRCPAHGQGSINVNCLIIAASCHGANSPLAPGFPRIQSWNPGMPPTLPSLTLLQPTGLPVGQTLQAHSHHLGAFALAVSLGRPILPQISSCLPPFSSLFKCHLLNDMLMPLSLKCHCPQRLISPFSALYVFHWACHHWASDVFPFYYWTN